MRIFSVLHGPTRTRGRARGRHLEPVGCQVGEGQLLLEHYHFARQLEQAEERGAADEQEEEEEEEDDDEGEQEDEGTIIPMPGQDLVSVGAMVVGTGEKGFQDGAAAAVPSADEPRRREPRRNLSRGGG